MKTILFFLFFALTLGLSAQYTITSASNPVVGDIEGYAYTYSTGLTVPVSGTNKTWNYSLLQFNNSNPVSSSTYVPVSSVPNNTLFPSSTIGLDYGQGQYELFKINSSTRDDLGSASSTASACTAYSNAITLLTLPFYYGSSYFDTFGYTSQNINLTGNVTTLGDGTGTLVLPGYTLTNVLKISYTFNEVYTFQSNVTTTSGIQHDFYSALSKFPLFSITSTTNTSNSVTTTDINASVNKLVTLGAGIKESALENSFKIYPNPANNDLVFIKYNTNISSEANITLLNTLGQEVRENHYTDLPSGENKLNFDLNGISPGIYYLRMETSHSKILKKLVIE